MLVLQPAGHAGAPDVLAPCRRPGGARSAVLLKHYDRLQASSPGAFPVVRLKPGGYQDSRYGWVHTPLTSSSSAVSPGHTAAIPDTSLKAEMNDEIPF